VQISNQTLDQTSIDIVNKITIWDAHANPDGKNSTNVECKWKLTYFYYPFYFENVKPYFMGVNKNITMTVNETRSLILATDNYSNDTVSVTYKVPNDFKECTTIKSWNPNTFEANFVFKPFSNAHVGNWKIEFTLTDRIRDNEKGEISLVAEEIIYVIVMSKNQYVVEEEEGQTDMFLVDTVSMSLEGLVTVTFTEEVVTNPRLYNITQEKIKTIIEIKMIPGEFQDPQKIGIKSY